MVAAVKGKGHTHLKKTDVALPQNRPKHASATFSRSPPRPETDFPSRSQQLTPSPLPR